MIHGWRRTLLKGASGVFEPSGKKALHIDEEQVRNLHTKIEGWLLPTLFLVRKLKP